MLIYERLSKFNEDSIKEMSALATDIVKEHYNPLIGPESTAYRLNKYQSVTGIKEQLAMGSRYYFVNDEKGYRIGFLAFFPEEDSMFLSKFYLKKEFRSRGYGREMLNYVIAAAKAENLPMIRLETSVCNGTVSIYERMGFERIDEVIEDIGGGYSKDCYIFSMAV